ncbi:MAG: hypothetical protein M1820_010753 [Bogoriella megaspora]|nr:MAG: hypothetical protein M1820_010753 [Bogoriella megaspora]
MPLITSDPNSNGSSSTPAFLYEHPRKQSQHSILAQTAMSRTSSRNSVDSGSLRSRHESRDALDELSVSNHAAQLREGLAKEMPPPAKPLPQHPNGGSFHGMVPMRNGVGNPASDTPAPSAPNSPRMYKTLSFPLCYSSTTSEMQTANGKCSPPNRQNSGTSTPRTRPTTLDIPGLTKSKVSPDGRIAQRDVGAKLVIVMVGLPARGKSYITKKLARYLNWLQHDTRIFNVGERRRVAAGGPKSPVKSRHNTKILPTIHSNPISPTRTLESEQQPAKILVNGATPQEEKGNFEFSLGRAAIQDEPGSMLTKHTSKSDPALTNGDLEAKFPNLMSPSTPEGEEDTPGVEQSAEFFDPNNKKASLIREQVAVETLDELLDYILNGNGSVGILDATNSTLERRKLIVEHIRERAGSELNILFVESCCMDEKLLESNMRLKLSGPDYKDKDPVASLIDFKKRVAIYQKAYVPLGDYEEKNNMSYIQMIDVGRKLISHQIKGFLSAQANYYLLNFNLAPRQIWITRHGESTDNVAGKIGGDSELSPAGQRYAAALTKFVDCERKVWELHQLDKMSHSHFPPQPGDTSPPNPYFEPVVTDENEEPQPKHFCVWTSMLKRSIQTAQFFDEEEFDSKQMRMLDELNAGIMEGMTYADIRKVFPEEYEIRKRDKLHYRYPGPGGEGYLDIINRLRPVIVELERMTDHVLLVGHRSVARVLLAYFRGLGREEVADLDVPIGMLYCLEPKPYGVDFKAYRYNAQREWFEHLPDFELKTVAADSA